MEDVLFLSALAHRGDMHLNEQHSPSGTTMKILNYTDAPSTTFDSELAKGVTGRVVIGKDDNAHNFCMRVFTLEPGGFSPRHAHEWEHEIFIHSGKGQVFKDGEWTPVTSGTVVFIPGNEEHQFMNAGAEEFTFICLIPSGVAEM
jgi:quercetin dioxygenase-like cupin family protein